MTTKTKSNALLACEMNAIDFLNQASEHSMHEFKLEIKTINDHDFYNISVDGDTLMDGYIYGIGPIQIAALMLRNYVINHTNKQL